MLKKLLSFLQLAIRYEYRTFFFKTVIYLFQTTKMCKYFSFNTSITVKILSNECVAMKIYVK